MAGGEEGERTRWWQSVSRERVPGGEGVTALKSCSWSGSVVLAAEQGRLLVRELPQGPQPRRKKSGGG